MSPHSVSDFQRSPGAPRRFSGIEPLAEKLAGSRLSAIAPGPDNAQSLKRKAQSLSQVANWKPPIGRQK